MTALFTTHELVTLLNALDTCPAEAQSAALHRLHEYRVQATILDTLLRGYTQIVGLDEFGELRLALTDAGRTAAREATR